MNGIAVPDHLCILGTCPKCGRHMDNCPACNGDMDRAAFRLEDWKGVRKCECGNKVIFFVGDHRHD